MTTADDAREQLAAYLEHARWFGSKGRPFRIEGTRRLGEVPGSGNGGPRAAIDLVTVAFEDDEGGTEMYQLPLAFYEHRQDHLEHARIGSWADEDFGTSHVYDAVHDREAMACWLRSFAEQPAGPAGLPPAPRARARRRGRTRRSSAASSPTPRWPSARTR